MTTVYGPYASCKTKEGYTRYLRGYIDYTYSAEASATSSTMSVSAIGYTGKSGMGEFSPSAGSIKVTMSDTAGHSLTGTNPTNKQMNNTTKFKCAPASTTNYSFTRGHSSATYTVTITAKRTTYSSNTSTQTFNLTVPARPSYTVTYYANGGSAASAQTKWYGESLALRGATTRSGFSFKRWNTNASDTGTGYNAGATYTGNTALNLYAIWNHTVTFNANGGAGAPSAQTALATSAISLSTSRPTLSGYEFVRWNTKTDNTGAGYNPGGTYAANGANVTLYAIWQRRVTYKANGGAESDVDETSLKTDTAYLIRACPFTRSGWRFTGWKTAASGGTSYEEGATYSGESLTLYAQWERAVSAVTIGTPKAIRVEDASATTEADDGTYAYVRIPYMVTGAAAADVDFAVTCSDKEGNPATIISGGTGSVSKLEDETLSGEYTVRAGGALETDKSYLFDIAITAANTTVTQDDVIAARQIELSTAFFTMDVLAGGHGVSFGAPAKDEVFKVAMPFEQGSGTIAASDDQAVVGRYNVEDNNGDYLFVIGNGLSDNERANAFAVDAQGTTFISGQTMGTAESATPSGLQIRDPANMPLSQDAAVGTSIYGDMVAVSDMSGGNRTNRAHVRFVSGSNGDQGVQIETTRRMSDGTFAHNGLVLYISPSGARSFYLHDAAAFRKAIGAVKVLWSGAYYMNGSQTITLNDSVSNQLNGVVLAWSAYVDGAAQNRDWIYTFVPKSHVANHNGTGVYCPLMSTAFSKIGCKYVYVSNGTIEGYAYNASTGTNSGITYTNNYWVLRYVLGV